MAILLLVINLLALMVIWGAAMFFYLRHGAPACAGQHYGQIALVLIAVGAFAAAAGDLRSGVPGAWDVLLRAGVAMVAARYLLRAWRQDPRDRGVA